MLSVSLAITDAVRQQYEDHPYPHYGLLLPLRWQEAYGSTALFSAQLAREHGFSPALDHEGTSPLLIAGCGDTFAAQLARWEPHQHPITACDLSARNLRRSRLRCWQGLRSPHFMQANLETTDLFSPSSFAHVDAYGVVHHLSNPRAGLQQLSLAMRPGATLRLMVYNRKAREWIHHVQRAFALLGLDQHQPADVRQALELLDVMSRHLPVLRERLAGMRAGLKASRLVDTFLHAREARIDISEWYAALEASGLQILGLFDRYGELDDLPNPLYQLPTAAQLEVRASDRRYENNLELFCMKPGAPAVSPRLQPLAQPWSLYRQSPPRSWSSYSETAGLSWRSRWQLWQNFRQTIYRQSAAPLAARLQLPKGAAERLARIGALWPSRLPSAAQRTRVLQPLHSFMEIPEQQPTVDPSRMGELTKAVEKVLLRKGLALGRVEMIVARIAAAQV